MPTALSVRDDLVAEFIVSIVSDQGGSENTAFAYKTDLNQFCAGLPKEIRGANGINWQKVGRNHVESFLDALSSAGYAECTVARKLSAVKAFFAWLTAEGMVRPNPLEDMKSHSVPKRRPKALTVGQVESLLKQPRKAKGPVALRDTSMIELVYATGLRASELVSLNLNCVVIERRSPLVLCRNTHRAKERIIPIHQTAVAVLRRYLEDGRPKLTNDRCLEQAFFVNQRGERMTRQGFWLILKGYAKAAKIGTVTPQTLRHSFAIHMLSGGAPPRVVQELLGHANLSTTLAYTQAKSGKTRRALEAARLRTR